MRPLLPKGIKPYTPSAFDDTKNFSAKELEDEKYKEYLKKGYDEGFNSGYEDGLKKGYDEGIKKAQNEIKKKAEKINNISVILKKAIDEISKLKYHDLVMDLLKKEVYRGNKKIDLTAKEYELLKYLMENAEKIVTRNMILANVFDIDFDIESNVVDVQIHRLRDKIDKGFDKKLIHTVRGFGYVLKAN